MLLEDIDSGDETFLIVERLSDVSGQTYIQTIRDDDETYRVERRDGSPERHYTTSVADKNVAHALITAWAFELPSMAPAVEWTPTRLAD